MSHQIDYILDDSLDRVTYVENLLTFNLGKKCVTIGNWTMEKYRYGMDWDGVSLDDVGYPLFINLLRMGKWKF